MKFTSKLMIALALTLVLSLVSLSVWAAPSPQGTVPLIPVTGGTIQINLLCGCEDDPVVTRFSDPKKEVGPAPTGFDFLSDTFKLENVCDIEICYPYPEDYKDQKGQIFIWDAVNEAWGLTDSTIYGEPKQICTVVKKSTGNIYSLITSDKIKSLETPSKVTLCGCSADDTVTNVEDPKTTVGAAPAGLTILTNATKVECSAACEVKVCYPYTEENKSKDGQIYKWDETNNAWGIVASTIDEDNEQICTVVKSSLGGAFTLIGN